MSEKKFLENKVVLKNVRLSYVNLWEPKDWGDGSQPKYETVCLIDKDNTAEIKKLENAYKKAYNWGLNELAWTKKDLRNLNTFIKDGDDEEKEKEGYANCYYINTKAKNKPVIVDKYRAPITDEDEIYSGVIANVCIYVYAYNKGGKGVTAIIDAVQKVRDAEPLGGGVGKVNVNDVFESLVDEGGELPFDGDIET